MRRALDLLVPGGVGVFLIPAGFLSGNLNRGLREKLLRRHHLLGAFRLSSHDKKGRETVPGASVVMDVVFCRRGRDRQKLRRGPARHRRHAGAHAGVARGPGRDLG